MDYIFEWNQIKAELNYKKHGISFEEATTVFYDSNALEMKDEKHSQFERRWILLGYSVAKRLLVVIFTVREKHIRIISARTASRKERNSYEKAIS